MASARSDDEADGPAPPLSPWTRGYVADVLPWCAAHGASFVAFAPLGRSFLTGAIPVDARFEADISAPGFRASGA